MFRVQACLPGPRQEDSIVRLQFIGGVSAVTGSQHLIEINGARILRDCGMFQGRRAEARDRNENFPFDPREIDAVALSHAHIDHCGNLPTLARSGFRGDIHTTTATALLCDIMLKDSARIQEQDAAYLNQKTNRQGEAPIIPLYTAEDAVKALRLFKGHRYGEKMELAPGASLEFVEAGHILGAALNLFELEEAGRKARIGFAVDLGRKNLPIIRNPDILSGLDLLVLESTYGGRLHANAAGAADQLCAAIKRAFARGGKVLIPSFALERAQEILYHLAVLVADGRLPELPVYVDSPMATSVTRVFEKCHDYMDEDYVKLRRKSGSVMSPPWVRFTASVDESKAVTSSNRQCLVIAGSGMCENGRILHHLKHGIENPDNLILLVGYQASHTLGRRLIEKEPKVRIFGDWFNVRAEVDVLNAFSGHADRNELLEYARAARPAQIALVHGEPDQRLALAEALRASGKTSVLLPEPGDSVEL